MSLILSPPLHHGQRDSLVAECLTLIGPQVGLLCQAHSTGRYICTSDATEAKNKEVWEIVILSSTTDR